MSYQQLLSIGYIPKDHPGGLISCGDSTNSGTSEITFIIEDDTFTSPELPNLKVNGTESDWFDANDGMWASLSNEINTFFGQAGLLSGEKIAGVWCHLMDEPLEDGPEIISLDSEFGEFENESNNFNGRFYFRYQQVEDDEYTSDQILICE